MKGSLRILRGNSEERVVPLESGRYGIGRGQESTIQIESRRVSRHHAEIVVEGEEIRLIDCGSANGTLLNGEQVKSAQLRSGDRISIGEVVLELSEIHAPSLRETVVTMGGRILLSLAPTGVRRPQSIQKLLFGAVTFLMLTLSTVSGLAFRSLVHSRLSADALDHAQVLVRYLAEKNREDLRIGNEMLLDVGSVTQEPGVREAYVINTEGRILAPASKLHRQLSDPFITEALAQNSDRKVLPSPPLADGTQIFVHPVRAFNDKSGLFETLGAVKLVFSAEDAVGSLAPFNRLILLLIVASAILALLVARRAAHLFTAPIVEAAERIERWRAGLPAQPGSRSFEEWTPLAEAIDRLTEESKK